MNNYDIYHSNLGNIIIVSDGNNLVGVYFEKQKYYLYNIDKKLIKREDLVIKETKEWLNNYFAGNRPNPKKLILKPNGTDFQKLVWKILLEIPYGNVLTYKEVKIKVEKILQRKMANQAVGNAISHNPISIIIPCHRVIGSNGSLTGYAGGVDRKRKLLNFEGIDNI